MPNTIKSIFVTTLLLFFIQSTFAQKPVSLKFGKTSTSSIMMEKNEDFPDADAVYLMNIGRTYLLYSGGLKLAEDRHFRIKIFNEAGQAHADIPIPYYADDNMQQVSSIKATTYYVQDGKVVEQKVKKSEIFDEDVNGYWRQKRIAMPNAKPGAVIEVKYTKISKGFSYIGDWYFQKKIPVLYSQFSKEVLQGFHFNTVSRGSVINIDRSKKQTSQNLGGQTYNLDKEIFIAEKIAPLKKEAYVANINNYAAHLTFQLKKIDIPGVLYQEYEKTWESLNNEWLESKGSLLKPSGAVKNELAQVELGGKEATDKIAAIYHYVQNTYTHNDMLGEYPRPEKKQLIKEKKGNGSAINVLLISMLKAAGMEAHPCLISTRKNGLVQSYFADTDQFNHLIAAVKTGEEYMLLDASEKDLPVGMLPYRDLNLLGLLIKNTGPKWVSLEPSLTYKKRKSGNFQILADGSLEGKVTCQHYDYSAFVERQSLRTAQDKNNYLQTDLVAGFEDAELIDYSLKEESTIYEPFTTVSELEVNDNVESSIGDRIYFKPLLNETIKENPFTLEKRSYPVDFGYGSDETYTMSYMLPEGYEVESVPEPIRMATPGKGMIFQYQTQVLGNMLQVQCVLQIKKGFFLAEQYPEIKMFYEQIVKKHGEQVVLRRKS